MINILITGANGQLGLSIKALQAKYPDLSFIFTDIEELDITNPSELEKFFSKQKFDFLINCAAYTAVDKAEVEKDKAWQINVQAVEFLANMSVKHHFRIIHISTDYVFSGQHFRPYTEEEFPNPASVYATTKYEAEKRLMELSNTAIILRTSWLYSEYGNNFVKTILKLAKERNELRIITDQIGSPTYAGDLVTALMNIVTNYPKSNSTEIYHFSNQGIASWYDFAVEIICMAGLDCSVIPIRTEEYPLPAKRPFYSVLDKRKFSDTFETNIPHWKLGLKTCITNLNEF
jgi:dTDP-4-dehydrorhamnose reductase